ncbi:MAG: hypothetical protein ABEJ40_06590 [Haloarculaceae archaeon]
MQPDGEPGRDRWDDGHTGYRAIIERYENAPDQCTIFPADAADDERTVSWISAENPAFVDLRSCR